MTRIAALTKSVTATAAVPTTRPYFYGYALVLGLLVIQAVSTIYHSSLALRDTQSVAQLQAYKAQLTTAQITNERTIALNLAIKPIQTEMSTQYQPITQFLTATSHNVVASR